MKKLRGVKFSMRRWSGQRSKDDGSIQMSVRPVPEILSRSVSLNSLDKDRDASNLKISPNIPPTQASQESVLEKNLIRPPSLRLDLSRASSYGGSMNTLANSPTIRKEGFLFYRELTLTENDSLVMMLSAVYAKLLVVMGISFPLAEVISHKIPASYYEGFYLYLYMGSIFFLIYVYLFLLRSDNPKSNSLFKQVLKRVGSVANSIGTLDTPSHKRRYNDAAAHCGSFYLRLGALAFGIGSMIYSGLEFGQFFEIDVNSHCYNLLYALTPSSRMAFTFIQLYFIFLNSRMAISKYKTLARFGLMHMIATNLCVWLHVLVQETKHEMLTPNATHLIPAYFMKQSESHHSGRFITITFGKYI